jgi:hypothetical protein
MARRGALTALQAALAGVSGGAQGYIQQRELERKREQEQADRERQQAIDVMGLQERGYTTAEQYAKQRQGATARGGQVASQALLSALNPMAGAPPVAQVTGEGVSALSRALAMPEEPGQRVAFGGQEFVRAESPEQATARERRLEGERGRLERKAEIDAERAWRSEEAKLQRDFTAQQNRLDRQAKQTVSQVGEINPIIARNASTLRDDYRAEPAVKNSEIIARQTRIVQAAAKREDPASDLSLIFAYMKVLDPGSVVREREFANAQNAASVPDQVRNLYNRVLRGTRLNPTQRSQFLSSAIDIAQTQRAEMRAQNQRYSAIATRYGVPSDLVIYDPFETLFPETEEANQRMTVPPPVTVPEESTGRGRPDLGRLLQTPTRRP